MNQKDNSIVKIATLHYKKYSFKEYPTSLIAIGYQSESIDFHETKLNIFKDFLKLGENLFNTIEHLEISDEITRFIDTETLDSNKLKIEFHDFFPTEFFYNISSLIYNNKEAMNYVSNWLKKYGLPNIDTSIYYDINQFNSNNNDEVKYISRLINSYECDILPLINSSIMFYLIFNLQNCIAQAKLKFLKKYIAPFPYLREQYEEYCYYPDDEIYEYDAAYGSIINSYIKKLIQILTSYLQDSICSRDESEILYPDTILPDTKDDIEDISDLFPTEYLMRSPILLVFEYLCRVLTLRNFKSTIYYCDNCNEMLASNEELCIGCKLSLGNNFLEFHTKKINKHNETEIKEIKNMKPDQLTKYEISILNSIDYISLLKNEIESIKEKGVASTPTIIQLYRNNRDQHQHNKKRKASKVS